MMILKNSKNLIFTLFNDKVVSRLQIVKKLKNNMVPSFEHPVHIADISYQNLYQTIMQNNLDDSVIFSSPIADILPNWNTQDIIKTYFEDGYINILDIDRFYMHLDILKDRWWIKNEMDDLYYQILLLCYLIGDIDTAEQIKGACGQKWNPVEYMQFILSFIISTTARRENMDIYKVVKCKMDYLITSAKKSKKHEYIYIIQLIKSLLCDDIGFTVRLLMDQHINFDLSMEELITVLIKMDVLDMVDTKDIIASLVFKDLLNHCQPGLIKHVLIDYLNDGIPEEIKYEILHRAAIKFEKEMYFTYARCIYEHLGMSEMVDKVKAEHINVLRSLTFF